MHAFGMETGTLFGVLTTVLLATFVGGWIWAWRPSRRAVFDAAARLPLDDEMHPKERDVLETAQ
jgi:cytochrome c oxidase cbb3-type subunit 4